MVALLVMLVVLVTASVASAAEVVRPLYNAPIVVQKQFELPPTPPMRVLPSDPRSRAESVVIAPLPVPPPRQPDGLFQYPR